METNKNFADRPKKLRLYTLRVDRLEASKKFEGRFVLNGHIHGLKASSDTTEVKLWMSQKQANSVQKNMDSKVIFAVIDVVDREKPRFVWASNNQEWLAKAFLEHPDHDLGVPTQDVAAPVGEFDKFSKTSKPLSETRFMNDSEELPF